MPDSRHWETYSASNRPMQDGFYECARLRKDESGDFWTYFPAEYQGGDWQTTQEVTRWWPVRHESARDAMNSDYPPIPTG